MCLPPFSCCFQQTRWTTGVSSRPSRAPTAQSSNSARLHIPESAESSSAASTQRNTFHPTKSHQSRVKSAIFAQKVGRKSLKGRKKPQR